MVKRVALTRPAYTGRGYLKSTVVEDPAQGREAPLPPPPFREREREGAPRRTRVEIEEKNTEAPDSDSVLKLANQLSPADRKALLDKLALQHGLESTPAASDRELNMWTEAIHDALQEALGSSAGADVGFLVVRRTVGARSAWAPVTEFMELSRLSELTVTEKRQAYRLLAQLLVDHARFVARKSGAPLGPKLVGSCAGSIRGVFENSFPGYLQAGLARVVARQVVARGRNPEHFLE